MSFIWCYYKISNIFLFHSKSTKTQFLLFQRNHLFKFTSRDWTLLPIIRYYPVPNIACHVSVSLSLSSVLCILTSFWVLHGPKSWLNYFFKDVFNLFCSFKIFFSDFTAEIRVVRPAHCRHNMSAVNISWIFKLYQTCGK